ncbi:MAG: glycoside hydrolase family 25 protein [Oscillospiraceae bacterium]
MFAAALIFGLCACGAPPFVDPHAGMVSVADGRGGEMWVPLYEELPVSNFSSEEFFSEGAFVDYGGTKFEALRGIDVSEHQGEIDWAAVRGDGVEFAIIRAGYRGFSEGELFEDAFFRKNIEGALAAGIKVGIYFFSQAISVAEAVEEADFLLKIIEGYKLSLPVFYDWERIGNGNTARTDEATSDMITDGALAFCSRVSAEGYEAGVYFYRSLGYLEYELNRLAGLTFWAAAPGVAPDFYYEHRFWQYSYTGTVKGIATAVDLNLMFLEIPPEASPTAPNIVPGEIPPPEVSLTAGA